MSEVRIAAESRTEFGKGAARRIRRDNKVPAVLYGHGTEPRHISLPGHELMLALKTANVLLTLDIEGKDELALPKDVQRDPIKGFLEHVDLVVVRRGEKVTVEIGVHLIGEAAPGDPGRPSTRTTLSVEAEATHIPTGVDVSVEGLQRRRPDPRQGRHAARRRHPGHRPGRARRQRHRGADRRAARGRARRGRGRGRHRPRAHRRGAGRRGRGCRRGRGGEGESAECRRRVAEGEQGRQLSLLRPRRSRRAAGGQDDAGRRRLAGRRPRQPRARPTPATGTTSASWSSTCWPSRMGGALQGAQGPRRGRRGPARRRRGWCWPSRGPT